MSIKGRIPRISRIAGTMVILTLALAAAGPTAAQIRGGGVRGVPGGGLPSGVPDFPTRHFPDPTRNFPVVPQPARIPRGPPLDVAGIAANAADLAAKPLNNVRREAVERLLREHADVVETDDQGQPVVRGEILALGASPETLKRLKQIGFKVRATNTLADLGLQAIVLGLPRGVSAVDAIGQIKAVDPDGQYDFDHIYQVSGETGTLDKVTMPAGSAVNSRGLRIGLVDGSVAPSAPALARARLTQRSFAAGGARATAHATAVASLMIGDDRSFRGAAPGAALYVADVYGAKATGGSALNVAQGLAWLAKSGVPVINISLVGPPNVILAAAVQALVDRGHLVVAAVGNDGPAAAPLYPAAYPGVIAVTAVDARKRVLPEAGRGTHVDFAAPGSDIMAASLYHGFVHVRGTSFAAPIVAARLARLLLSVDRAGAKRAVEVLARDAIELGAAGPDPTYGKGFIDVDFGDGTAAQAAAPPRR